MSRQSRYSWSAAYEAAARETDFRRLHARIEGALKTIEERLDGPTKLDDTEFTDIQDALRALQMLRTEKTS
jgi:hypothetical protein